MKYLLLVLLLIGICAPCMADDQLPKSGIFVSGNVIVVPALPPETRQMTPAEFFQWAMKHNDAQREASVLQHETVRSQLGDRTVRGTFEESWSDNNLRMGGGVGANGWGGEGGYAGYSNQFQPINNGFSYGFGFTNPGNASQGSTSSYSRTYEKVWHDRAYYGKALHVINPFCPPSK